MGITTYLKVSLSGMVNNAELLESDEVSLNVDHVGTQDLKVEFADKAAGYNLAKGSELKVRFLMKSAGGCFLPFGGREATVVQ